MKVAQLKVLVKRGESENLEFKASTANLNAGMQTACAFLNSDHGGTVIFGVKDDGTVVGQLVNDKTRKDLAVELNKIEPHAKIDVKYVRVTKEKQAIVLLINPGDKAPYTYDGRSFMRSQSTTLRMPKEDYSYLHSKSNPTLWESLRNDTCTIKDLDHERIKEVVRMGVFAQRLPESAVSATIANILKKLDLLVGEKLTNAAVILFCKNENKQFLQSNIQLARFKGITKSEFINSKKYRANAFDLYDKAMNFLVTTLPVAARIVAGHTSRVETPAIPYNFCGKH
jgi:ATP-dependent DNA helicase RecG